MYNNNHIKLIMIICLSTLIIFPASTQQIPLKRDNNNWQNITELIKKNKLVNKKKEAQFNNSTSIKTPIQPIQPIQPINQVKTLHVKSLQQFLQDMHINFQKIVAYFLQAKNNVIQALRSLTNLQKETKKLNDISLEQSLQQTLQALENLQLIQNDASKIYSEQDINHAVEDVLNALSNLEQYKKEKNFSNVIPKGIEEIQQQFNNIINNIIEQKAAQKTTKSNKPEIEINSIDFSSLFENINHKIIQTHQIPAMIEQNIISKSQPQIDPFGREFETATGDIQTPDQYIQDQRNYLTNQLNGINQAINKTYTKNMNENCRKNLQETYKEKHPALDKDSSQWTADQKEAFAEWTTKPEQTAHADNFKRQYQIEHPKDANRTLERLSQDLNNYQYVINSRGDGNCGYRAILISNYMQGLKNPAVFENLEHLLQNNFIRLFTKYDNLFKGDKDHIAQELLQKMLETIERMKTCKNEHEIQNIIQNDTVFDYAMIMFERYAMADIMNREESSNLMDFIQDEKIGPMKNNVLTWTKELDQNETSFLAKAMNLTIHTIQRDTNSPEQIVSSTESNNHAYILYMPGHYQILVPKTSSDQAPLAQNDSAGIPLKQNVSDKVPLAQSVSDEILIPTALNKPAPLAQSTSDQILAQQKNISDNVPLEQNASAEILIPTALNKPALLEQNASAEILIPTALNKSAPFAQSFSTGNPVIQKRSPLKGRIALNPDGSIKT